MPKKKKYPNKVLILPNKDKNFHESYEKGDDLLSFVHPFRMLLSGGVNSGKTNLILNILIRQRIPFERIIIYHCDGNFTKEYEDIDAEYTDSIPPPTSMEYFGSKQKTCFIMEDIDYKRLKKDQLSNLNRLLGFVSTHRNVSVLATSQTFFNVPPMMRRMTNIFVIWGNDSDQTYIDMFARKVGEKPEVIKQILSGFTNQYDFLLIDLTSKKRGDINGISTKLRKNAFELIEVKERVNEVTPDANSRRIGKDSKDTNEKMVV